jgi:DNA-binding transcriptional regulator YdaS (Cro superfamily)
MHETADTNDAIAALKRHLELREADEPGQQTRLAEFLHVTSPMVWQWLNRTRPIAPKHARGIEAYTKGAVTAVMVAPVVFGFRTEHQRQQPAAE